VAVSEATEMPLTKLP